MWHAFVRCVILGMMKLEEVVDYQNDLLRISEFEDYPNALNGLQLENSGTVSRIAAAVDACEPILEMARPPVRIS